MRYICALVFLLAFFEEPTIAGEPRKLKAGKKGKQGKKNKSGKGKAGGKAGGKASKSSSSSSSSDSDDDKDYFPNPFAPRTCDEKCKSAARGEIALNVTTTFQVDTGKIYDFFNVTIIPKVDNTVVGFLANAQGKLDEATKGAKDLLVAADANVAKAAAQYEQAQAQVRTDTH